MSVAVVGMGGGPLGMTMTLPPRPAGRSAMVAAVSIAVVPTVVVIIGQPTPASKRAPADRRGAVLAGVADAGSGALAHVAHVATVAIAMQIARPARGR